MKQIKPAAAVLGILAIVLLMPAAAQAHCDTMNGPVVKAARKALETDNVNLVLVWVQKKEEGEIRKAFAKTMAVRKLNPEARELADMYFFETLVRIHRAGEGVPYTGLKPADAAVDGGIAAADRALEGGSAEELVNHSKQMLHEGIQKRFAAAQKAKSFKSDDLEGGRAYVRAYVRFIHYVERVHQAMQWSGEEQDAAPAKTPAQEHH